MTYTKSGQNSALPRPYDPLVAILNSWPRACQLQTLRGSDPAHQTSSPRPLAPLAREIARPPPCTSNGPQERKRRARACRRHMHRQRRTASGPVIARTPACPRTAHASARCRWCTRYSTESRIGSAMRAVEHELLRSSLAFRGPVMDGRWRHRHQKAVGQAKVDGCGVSWR